MTVVDNLLAVDPLELQESQQRFNTSARLLMEAETYTTVVYSSSKLQLFVPTSMQLLVKQPFSVLSMHSFDAYFSVYMYNA